MKDVGKTHKLLILYHLKEKPLHGYALMEDIARRWGKKPSAGLVYPILSELKDEGLVEVIGVGRREKKVYKITKKGLRYLRKNRERMDEIQRRFAIFKEFSSMGAEELRDALHHAFLRFEDLNEEQKKKLGNLIRKAAMEIRYIVEFGGEGVE